jgi:uncharacterized membrane protein YeiB
VADGERYVLLDLLRGIALFGILLINITIFANPDELMGFGDRSFTPDRAVQFLILWLVQAKFYSLFSFLFGLGFAVMIVTSILELCLVVLVLATLGRTRAPSPEDAHADLEAEPTPGE